MLPYVELESQDNQQQDEGRGVWNENKNIFELQRQAEKDEPHCGAGWVWQGDQKFFDNEKTSSYS